MAQQKTQAAPAGRLGGHAEFESEQGVVQSCHALSQEPLVINGLDTALGRYEPGRLECDVFKQPAAIEPLGLQIIEQGANQRCGDRGWHAMFPGLRHAYCGRVAFRVNFFDAKFSYFRHIDRQPARLA